MVKPSRAIHTLLTVFTTVSNRCYLFLAHNVPSIEPFHNAQYYLLALKSCEGRPGYKANYLLGMSQNYRKGLLTSRDRSQAPRLPCTDRLFLAYDYGGRLACKLLVPNGIGGVLSKSIVCQLYEELSVSALF